MIDMRSLTSSCSGDIVSLFTTIISTKRTIFHLTALLLGDFSNETPDIVSVVDFEFLLADQQPTR
jgi:hypothetical protein